MEAAVSAAENTVSNGRPQRRGLRALEAQRMIDLTTLRLAPSLAAGLIAYLHIGDVGQALVLFASVYVATSTIQRSQLPLHLMPASRVILGIATPLLGVGAGWLVAVAAGQSYSLASLRSRGRSRLARDGPRSLDPRVSRGRAPGSSCGNRLARVRRRLRR